MHQHYGSSNLFPGVCRMPEASSLQASGKAPPIAVVLEESTFCRSFCPASSELRLDWSPRGVLCLTRVCAARVTTTPASSSQMSKFVDMNQLEYLEPLMQTRVWRAQKVRSPSAIPSSLPARSDRAECFVSQRISWLQRYELESLILRHRCPLSCSRLFAPCRAALLR